MNLYPIVKRLKVITKQGLIVPFVPNRQQQEYLAKVHELQQSRRPVRLIVLKARQMGISTLTEAILFSYSFIFDNMRSLVVGNDTENAQHLLSMTNTYWEYYPFAPLYTPKYNSKNELAWVETNSSIKVATAKTVSVGRGKTIRCLHASEVAFWENAKKTMGSLSQAIPYIFESFICLESTANGVGNYFYNMWKAAEDQSIEYTPLFFPWYEFHEYCASYLGLEVKPLGQLDDEERVLRRMGVDDDRLTWRRYAIPNLCSNDLNTFHQEYPSTADEAFIASGTNVFPEPKLRQIYEPMEGRRGRLHKETNGTIRFLDDAQGPLTIYKTPSDNQSWGRYFIGADPTHTTRGDFAVAQVINRKTMEQVAIYRGRVDPTNFAPELAKLGTYYNEALIAPEVEGPGYATVSGLITLGYINVWYNKAGQADQTPGKHTDHFGWRTGQQTKNLAVGWLLKYIVDSANLRQQGWREPSMVIHDKQTFQELRDYVTLDGGGYGPAGDSDNDDTVMALAIAVTAHTMEPPLPPYQTQAQMVANGNGLGQPGWQNWEVD